LFPLPKILNQEIPLDDEFQNLTFDECYAKLVTLNYRPQIPENLPEEFSLSLQRAWHTDPNRRPSCRELMAAAERVLHTLHQESSIVGQLAGAGAGEGTQHNPIQDPSSHHSMTEL
jgi:hypothetical protein